MSKGIRMAAVLAAAAWGIAPDWGRSFGGWASGRYWDYGGRFYAPSPVDIGGRRPLRTSRKERKRLRAKLLAWKGGG